MGSQVASVEIQARTTGLRATLREARAAFGNFADNVGGLMKRGMAKAYQVGFGGKKKGQGEGFLRGAGKSAVGNLAADATARVTGFVAEVGKSTLDFEEKLARLQIQANETPEVMRAFADSVTLASNATGIGRDKVLEGANAFVTLTGKMDVAKAASSTFAKVAQATGSEVEDIAKTGAAAFQNLGIEAKDFEAMFSGMTAQGKMGAVELKDLATELSTIAPQWSQFGSGKGLQGAKELGAALQIVKRGFGGDAAETVTGLNNFLTAVTKKSARFRDAGVKSFFNVGKGGKKELKSVFEIVDLISKSKLSKDPEKLTKALGSSEAYRAFIQLRDGRKDMQGFVDAAGDATVIQRDFDTYMASSGGRMAKSWESMKNAVAAAFTPERITAFANLVEDLAGKVGTLVDGLGKVFGFMGTLNNVGKSVRGFMSGNENNNPWGSNPLEAAADENTASGDGAWIRTANGKMVKRDSAEGRGHVMAAQLRMKHRKGWDQTVGDIMGGEVNERTSPESIKRAAMASYAGNSNIGEQLAGQRYLKNAGVSDEEGRKIYAEHQAKQLAAIGVTAEQLQRQMLTALQLIAGNTGAGTKVQVGGDTIATATKEAPQNRRAVAK